MSHWSKACGRVSLSKIKEYTATSLNLAKKYNKEVHLITDYDGEKSLKDLNWDSIQIGLEDLPAEYSQVWSLGKIKSYNILSDKGDPFIHIDYDFFVFEDIITKLKHQGVFFQCKEDANKFYYNVKRFEDLCSHKYLSEKIRFIPEAYNCGIIGGNNLEFFKKYSNKSMSMVLDKNNSNFWLKDYRHISGFSQFTKAILAEQYYAQLVCQEMNITPYFFWNTSRYYPLNPKFICQNKCVHLYGDYKNMLETVASKLGRFVDLNFD